MDQDRIINTVRPVMLSCTPVLGKQKDIPPYQVQLKPQPSLLPLWIRFTEIAGPRTIPYFSQQPIQRLLPFLKLPP